MRKHKMPVILIVIMAVIVVAFAFWCSGITIFMMQSAAVLEAIDGTEGELIVDDIDISVDEKPKDPTVSPRHRNRYYNRLHYLINEAFDFDSKIMDTPLKNIKLTDMSDYGVDYLKEGILGTCPLKNFLEVYNLAAEICVRGEINPGITPYNGKDDPEGLHMECKQGLITPEVILAKCANEGSWQMLFGASSYTYSSGPGQISHEREATALAWEPYSLVKYRQSSVPFDFVHQTAADPKDPDGINEGRAVFQMLSGAQLTPATWETHMPSGPLYNNNNNSGAGTYYRSAFWSAGVLFPPDNSKIVRSKDDISEMCHDIFNFEKLTNNIPFNGNSSNEISGWTKKYFLDNPATENAHAGGFCGQSYFYSLNWNNENSARTCIYIPWEENPDLDDDKRAIGGLRRQLYAGEGVYLAEGMWEKEKLDYFAKVDDIKSSIKGYGQIENITDGASLIGTGGYFDSKYALTYGSRPSICYLPDAMYTMCFELRSQLVAGFSEGMSFPKMVLRDPVDVDKTVTVFNLPSNMASRGYSEENIRSILGLTEITKENFREYNTVVLSLILANQHMPNVYYDDFSGTFTLKGYEEYAGKAIDTLSKLQKDGKILVIKDCKSDKIETALKFSGKAMKQLYESDMSTDSCVNGLVAVNIGVLYDGLAISLADILESNDKVIREGYVPESDRVEDYDRTEMSANKYDYLWPLNSVEDPSSLKFVRMTTLFEYGYSTKHGALDLAQSNIDGQLVHAIMPGRVEKVFNSCKGQHYGRKENGDLYNTGPQIKCMCTGYGYHVVIDHNNGIKSIYAHMQEGSICVREGEIVKVGDVLGKVGTTGFSTGPHLHFEIQMKFNENGNYYRVNPLAYKASIKLDDKWTDKITYGDIQGFEMIKKYCVNAFIRRYNPSGSAQNMPTDNAIVKEEEQFIWKKFG